MERYTLTQRFTEERMLALTEQRTVLLAEAAEDKAAALSELRAVLEAAAAEDKAAALKELKLLLESVAAEDKARALAALKAAMEAAAAKAQAEALAALKAQLEAEFERQLAALRVRARADDACARGCVAPARWQLRQQRLTQVPVCLRAFAGAAGEGDERRAGAPARRAGGGRRQGQGGRAGGAGGEADGAGPFARTWRERHSAPRCSPNASAPLRDTHGHRAAPLAPAARAWLRR